ncbi:PEP/pyruvate-binding domain-containing protein [Hymenobacter jeollabukensis]|uniref:Phosphoenolpyruvate synthase n=1 Tax=Hymenobacter jeollabukensis TaxID=2025313 RepID=A0A5R8WJS3_9BACT|nr:PEP/pyruvate-binding domain-containing protein [Hymenobacter jeollabukensis]TLM89190.1 phosphoenolpyruvate synthase [Hymenobacter jeollabukensis]
MVLATHQPAGPDYTIGGKAAGLQRLRAAGLRVPDFVVIPAEEFDALPATSAAGDAEPTARRQQLTEFELPETLLNQLRTALHGWGFPHQPVVVRSSVADEDGQHAAFAGLMDSFLNLTSESAVLTAVARCAASAYSERALAYRRQKGLNLAARPAVIVQRQVAPVASGVMFTTFPEYPQELAIHAVWGFGEGLVGGQLQPDEFYFEKKTGQLHRQLITPKEEQLVARPAGGLITQAVEAGQQAAPCLGAAQLAELFDIGQRLEAAFGGPQDVEFVVDAAGAVWVVQARPITQAIPEVVVYDNSNIQESYCGVTTPLTFSFARRAYATVYRQTMHALGLPAAQIAAQEPVVTNLLGLVQGRIYYNINNWYRGLQLLPAFRQNKDDMERMMGLEEPVDFVQTREKTLADKLRLAPRLLLNLSRLLLAFARLDGSVRRFHAHFAGHYQRFYARPLSALSPAELLAEKARLDRELLGQWTTPIVNDFYVMMTNGRALRQLRQLGAAEPEELLRRYLAGDQDLASTQPTRRLLALAAQVRPQEPLRQLIVAQPDDLPAQVQAQFPAFAAEVAAFIAQFGDRTVGELKLETQTMRTRPQIFYQYLRNFLVGPAPAEFGAADHAVLRGAQAEVEALLRGKAAWRRRQLRQRLAQLQRAIAHRESLRLERTRLFGMYRGLYLAMGEQLTAAGQLAAPRDVFYLTEAEIEATARRLIGETAAAAETEKALPPLVAERQQEFASYARQHAPSRVTVPSPPLAAASTAEDEGALRGTGCYPGQLSGEIIVVTSPDDDLAVAGKIVCALRTDPGWAALFPVCRGVIIEKGSSLSHSVILLRELGIPTIINVPGLTRRLQSGQQVHMDGATGEIELL